MVAGRAVPDLLFVMVRQAAASRTNTSASWVARY